MVFLFISFKLRYVQCKTGEIGKPWLALNEINFVVRFSRLSNNRHGASSRPLRFTLSLRFRFRFWFWSPSGSQKVLQPRPQGRLLFQNLHQLQLGLGTQLRRRGLWFRRWLFRPQSSVSRFRLRFRFRSWSPPWVPRLRLCIRRLALRLSLGFRFRRRPVRCQSARSNLVQRRPKVLQVQQLPDIKYTFVYSWLFASFV